MHAAASRFDGTHQSSRARSQNNGVVSLFHARLAYQQRLKPLSPRLRGSSRFRTGLQM
jgi:hypothetical protein